MGISRHAAVFFQARIYSDTPSISRAIAGICATPLSFLLKELVKKEIFPKYIAPTKNSTESIKNVRFDPIFLTDSQKWRIFKIVMSILFSPLYLITLVIKLGLLVFSSQYRQQQHAVIRHFQIWHSKDSDFSQAIQSRPTGPSLEGLPPELLNKIGSNLEPFDLARLSEVDKFLHTQANHHLMWSTQLVQFGITQVNSSLAKHLVKEKFRFIHETYLDIFVQLLSVKHLLWADVEDSNIKGQKIVYDNAGIPRDPVSTKTLSYQAIRRKEFSCFEFSWNNNSGEAKLLYESLKSLFSTSFNHNGSLIDHQVTGLGANQFPRNFKFCIYHPNERECMAFRVGVNGEWTETVWLQKIQDLQSNVSFKREFRKWRERFFQLAAQ